METKTPVSAGLTSINNNEPAIPALQTDSSASKYATSTNVIDPLPETSTPQVLPTAPATKPPTYGRSRCNFTEPSSNPGFTYLYLPTRARMSFKEMRNSLLDLSFNSGSIVDIHYPAKNVVALLIHNEYYSTAINILKQNNLTPINNFDPLHTDNLADPKFKEATHEERSTQIRNIYENQIHRTIKFLRPPVKLAVARDFQRKGLITENHLKDLINLYCLNQPASASRRDNFKILNPQSDPEDLPMLSDEEQCQQPDFYADNHFHAADHGMLNSETNTSAGEANPAMTQ